MKTLSTIEAAQHMAMTQEVVAGIKEFIGDHRAEKGGLLGSNDPGIITHFAPDPTARCNGGAYDPDIDAMNRQIKEWKEEGIAFCGFVHSHPQGVRRLSSYDEWYAGEILDAFKKLDRLCLPIVMTVPDTGAFQILPYLATPGAVDRKRVKIVEAELRIAGADAPSADVAGSLEFGLHRDRGAEATYSPATVARRAKGQSIQYFGNFPKTFKDTADHDGNDWQPFRLHQREFDDDQSAREKAKRFLERMRGAFDLERLNRVRTIVIGTGGGQSLLRNMARMGFGEFVFIDPDTVSESNVASQQAIPDAIGQPKVVALAQDIVTLNPAAAALAIAERIENVSDEQFQSLMRRPMRASFGHFGRAPEPRPMPYQPEYLLLLVLTDSFWAQGRGHRLGLQFGVTTICAQEYKEEVGAEVTYTVPGITPACHRCITASRYRAYLAEGFTNDVTSHGAPIFAAEYLNAVLGHIVLAVVHHGTNHPLWGNVVQRLGDKNLLRMRMHPDFDLRFGDTFARRHEGVAGIDNLFMLDTLFLPQSPDCGQSASRPVCPDCNGSGNLFDAMGTFDDTRNVRR